MPDNNVVNINDPLMENINTPFLLIRSTEDIERFCRKIKQIDELIDNIAKEGGSSCLLDNRRVDLLLEPSKLQDTEYLIQHVSFIVNAPGTEVRTGGALHYTNIDERIVDPIHAYIERKMAKAGKISYKMNRDIAENICFYKDQIKLREDISNQKSVIQERKESIEAAKEVLSNGIISFIESFKDREDRKSAILDIIGLIDSNPLGLKKEEDKQYAKEVENCRDLLVWYAKCESLLISLENEKNSIDKILKLISGDVCKKLQKYLLDDDSEKCELNFDPNAVVHELAARNSFLVRLDQVTLNKVADKKEISTFITTVESVIQEYGYRTETCCAPLILAMDTALFNDLRKEHFFHQFIDTLFAEQEVVVLGGGKYFPKHIPLFKNSNFAENVHCISKGKNIKSVTDSSDESFVISTKDAGSKEWLEAYVDYVTRGQEQDQNFKVPSLRLGVTDKEAFNTVIELIQKSQIEFVSIDYMTSCFDGVNNKDVKKAEQEIKFIIKSIWEAVSSNVNLKKFSIDPQEGNNLAAVLQDAVSRVMIAKSLSSVTKQVLARSDNSEGQNNNVNVDEVVERIASLIKQKNPQVYQQINSMSYNDQMKSRESGNGIEYTEPEGLDIRPFHKVKLSKDRFLIPIKALAINEIFCDWRKRSSVFVTSQCFGAYSMNAESMHSFCDDFISYVTINDYLKNDDRKVDINTNIDGLLKACLLAQSGYANTDKKSRDDPDSRQNIEIILSFCRLMKYVELHVKKQEQDVTLKESRTEHHHQDNGLTTPDTEMEEVTVLLAAPKQEGVAMECA